MPDPRIQPISFRRRLAQTAIDGVVFYGIWVAVLNFTKVRFPFGFMQRFSQQDYDAYVRIMGWMTLMLFALSVTLHAAFGGSIGKLVMGHKTVHANGMALTPRMAAARSAIMFLLGVAILAPGPMVAFVYRAGSEAASLAVLMLGLGLWAFSTFPWQRGRSPLERLLGLVTVRPRDLNAIRTERHI